MKNADAILRDTAKILAMEVSFFRKIIVAAGGGELPGPIQEKQKLLHDIEKVLGEHFEESCVDSHHSLR